LTEQSERVVPALLLAYGNHHFMGLTGPHCGRKGVVRDFANSVGQMLLGVSCSQCHTSKSVISLLKGTLIQGMWMVLDRSECLSPNTLSLLAQFLQDVKAAIDCNK